LKSADGNRLTITGSFDVTGVGEMTIAVSLKVSRLFVKDQHVQLSFRPHAVTVDTKSGPDGERTIGMQGTVEASEFMGELTRYSVRVGNQSMSVDQAHYAGLSKLLVGTPLSLRLSSSQIRLFAA